MWARGAAGRWRPEGRKDVLGSGRSTQSITRGLDVQCPQRLSVEYSALCGESGQAQGNAGAVI